MSPSADWYDGLTGHTVFEFLDLLLTGLALAALFALRPRRAVRAPRARAALGIGLLALIIVLSQVVNDPPAVAGPNGRDQATGIWLALAGAALMVAGAVLSTARIAIAVEPRERPQSRADRHAHGRGADGRRRAASAP